MEVEVDPSADDQKNLKKRVTGIEGNSIIENQELASHKRQKTDEVAEEVEKVEVVADVPVDKDRPSPEAVEYSQDLIEKAKNAIENNDENEAEEDLKKEDEVNEEIL